LSRAAILVDPLTFMAEPGAPDRVGRTRVSDVLPSIAGTSRDAGTRVRDEERRQQQQQQQQ
jgi:hypothetical protein